MTGASPNVRRLLVWALAMAAYLVAGLVAMSHVLPEPSRLLAGLDESSPSHDIFQTDQKMVMATVIGNARRLVERPGVLRHEGQCYPLPMSYALGEHMFGEGLMAAPAWVATRDPVLSYNVMLLLRLWIPAIAMFAFVLHVARDPWAAFIAGLLYGVHHLRLIDPVHPFVYGDLWVPFALLFVHRLFEGAGWLVAVGLGVAVSLTILESLYPVLAALIVLAVYTLVLALRFPSRLPRVVPRVAFGLAISGVVAWFVYAPYLELKDTWGVLQGVSPMFAYPTDFLLGGPSFPGALLSVLAFVGMADRFRGARDTAAGDPRVGLLLAGFASLWCAAYYVPLPFTDIRFPSPLRMLVGLVPGLDSARSLHLVRIGVVLSFSALAGYGVLVLIERLRGGGRLAVVAGLSAVALVETLHPAVDSVVYGERPGLQVYRGGLVGPYRDFVEVIEPPVLDVPMDIPSLGAQAHFLEWATYHGGATAACYNSFPSPVQRAVAEIAERLPDVRAARALAAVGFSSVVLHEELVPRMVRKEVAARFGAASQPGFEEVDRAGMHAVFSLAPEPVVESSFGGLAAVQEIHSAVTEVRGESATVPFTFMAKNEATYRHPDPIAPSDLVSIWTDTAGGEVHRTPFRGLLPLGIAAGDHSTRMLSIPIEVDRGLYTVRIARSEAPDRILATARVRVE